MCHIGYVLGMVAAVYHIVDEQPVQLAAGVLPCSLLSILITHNSQRSSSKAHLWWLQQPG